MRSGQVELRRVGFRAHPEEIPTSVTQQAYATLLEMRQFLLALKEEKQRGLHAIRMRTAEGLVEVRRVAWEQRNILEELAGQAWFVEAVVAEVVAEVPPAYMVLETMEAAGGKAQRGRGDPAMQVSVGPVAVPLAV